MTLGSSQRALYSGLQIFGGGMYVLNCVNVMPSAADLPSRLLLIALAGVGLFSAILALQYLQGNQRLGRYCMWFWLLQVPTFATSWLSYRFFSGAELRVGIDFTNVRLFFDAQLGSGLVALRQLDGIATYVGVNSVALAASLFHMREQRNLPAPVWPAPRVRA
jgi:hypothetical protein